MEEKKIIFLTGVIGSGKDYNASKYEKMGYEKLSFADGVRDIAWQCLSWKPSSDEEYIKFKNMKISLSNNNQVKSEISGRDLLINIGDGFRDILDSKIWIKLLEKKLNKSSNDKFVISDCRYPNEILYFFASHDIEIKFCNYKSERYTLLDSRSEWMARKFIELGFQDGDTIPKGLIIDLYMEFNK